MISTFKVLFTNPVKLLDLKKAITISALQQFTGINMIILNSTFLLSSQFSSIQPEVSTIIVGVVNCVSSTLIIFILDCKI